MALPLPQHETRPRVARTWRRPNRENETSPLLIASAIPAGAQRIRRASQWIERIEASPGYALLRADAQDHIRTIALAILHRSDRLHLSRPTWAWLQEVTGLSRATIARYIARLRKWGLLATVAPGRRGIFAPGGALARIRPGQVTVPPENHDSDPANDAAVYVLCEPAQPREHAPDEESVDISETPPPYMGKNYPRTHAREETSPNSRPLRGPKHYLKAATRLHSGAAWRHLEPWPGSVTPSSQDNRLAAAGELQNRLPVLRQISTKHVRAICRPFFLAGWTVRDLIEAIDHRPDGSRWPHSGATGVGNVGAWLTHRLSPWQTHDGGIRRSPTQRRQTQRAETRARTRAMLETQRHTRQQITADPQRHNTARDRFFAWWETKKRAARRSPGQVSKPYKPAP